MNNLQNTHTDDDDFLPDRQASGITFFRIYEGMVCQTKAKKSEDQKPPEKFKEHESISKSTLGKKIFVREFDHMKGLMTGWEKVEETTNDGKKYYVFKITFTSPTGRKAIMNAPLKSEFVSRFAKCVENMDLAKPVYFRAFLNKKNRTAIHFEQGGQKIEQNYTKENPGNLPQWTKDEAGENDNRAYWTFLFGLIKEKALPQILRNNELLTQYPATEDDYTGPDDTDEDAERAAIAAANQPSSLTQKPFDDIPF